MPLIALLPCIMSHQFGRRKGNFSEDTYTAIFCSKHHHWAQSHFRFENKDTNCICNPLQKTKPTKSQKSSRSGMRSIKLFISQWTLKTRFWMQVPQTPSHRYYLKSSLLHDIRARWNTNITTWLFCQKSQQIQEIQLSYAVRMNTYLQKIEKNGGTAVSSQLQRTLGSSFLLRTQLYIWCFQYRPFWSNSD